MWNSLEDHLSKFSTTVSETCPGGIIGAVAFSIVSSVFLYYGINAQAKNNTKAKIKRRAARRRENVENLRKRLEMMSQDIDLSITEIPFEELQRKLQTGELSCLRVILAFQAKALAVHDKCNCVTGFIEDAELLSTLSLLSPDRNRINNQFNFWVESKRNNPLELGSILAYDRARKLDKLNATDKGPLHGMPLSMKEVVGVAGEDCTAGLSHFIDKIHTKYGVIMQVLIKQGAIPFARTNICQAQLGYTCSNPIFGETSNPLDHSRTPGGSSGGEGALIGGGGSILGLACDMGGSIRVPAHFCGACGIKPTADRMSGSGNLEMGHGIVTIGEICGPMGRDVDSLVAMMKAALVPEMYKLDPLLPQLFWREELYTSSHPMKIGFYTDDGGVEPVPAMKRAVVMAKQALEAMGHQVVEFAPFDVVNAVTEYGLGAIFSDDGQMFQNVMVNEVVDPSISAILSLPKIPYMLRRVMSKLLMHLHPVDRKLLLAKSCGNVYNWWSLNENVEEASGETARLVE